MINSPPPSNMIRVNDPFFADTTDDDDQIFVVKQDNESIEEILETQVVDFLFFC